MPTHRRPRQRPERRTFIGAETAMVRPLGILVGLGFIVALLCAIATTPLSNEPSAAHAFHEEPRSLALSSDGLLPHWDKAKLQRGLQVYREVCSACHSLNHVALRDVAALGYSEVQVKPFAKGFQVPAIHTDTGETATRSDLPSENFTHTEKERVGK